MKEIRLGSSTSVSQLSELLDVSANLIVGAGFQRLARMLTIFDTLTFGESRDLAESFAFKVLRVDDNGDIR